MNAAGVLAPPAPRRRVVLLGASNLARGIASAVAAADAGGNEPFDLLAALGHGRSYGALSWVLGRSLPAIVDCQLWDDLDKREPLPTSAIVTDVGNDILYGAAPEKISAWVKECCQRLSRHRAAIAITGIPLASLARLRAWEFRLFRSIFYPISRTKFADAIRSASELNERLRELSSDYGAQFVEPQRAWYGFDRIHIRRRAQAAAWRQFFAPLVADDAGQSNLARLGTFFYLRSLTPYQRWVFGIPNGRRQPSGRLAGGTLVSLY